MRAHEAHSTILFGLELLTSAHAAHMLVHAHAPACTQGTDVLRHGDEQVCAHKNANAHMP